ncbi:MAG: SDR family NAD(P)-dependent oxidoreductase [Candidatus Binatia bacterium]|nr:SDR family NAD(P)-dependent oxidoreductase [Candidatus Binatia bacterium]
MDLTNRVAVITGASRGLGAGIAKVASERGMSLVLCSRSTPALPPGSRTRTLEIDVSDPDAVDRVAREATEHFGHVDLWVNNAGLLEPMGPLRDAPPQDLKDHFDVNVLGATLGCRAFVRILHETNRRGVLLNISSGAARKPYAGWSAYCAGKAAIDRLSETIALEEGDRLKVHAVAPGLIDSDMQAQIRKVADEEFPSAARFRKAHADGTLIAPEVAGAALLDLAFNPAAARDEVCVDLRD